MSIKLVADLSYNLLYTDHAPSNSTSATPKPQETLTADQRLPSFKKLKLSKERYPEKEADKKMNGSQNVYLVLCFEHISIKISIYGMLNTFLAFDFSTSAIQSSTDILNMAMYISFGPVFILYFCYSWLKVNVYTKF